MRAIQRGKPAADDTGERHERGADEDGRAASVARSLRIFSSERLADANGGGRRNAERHHVGERDGVERDLMAGERNAPSRAMSVVTIANTPVSSVNCMAAGKPSAMSWRMRARSMSMGVLRSSVRWRRSYHNR